jgi:cell division protease FtsH
MVTRYGMDPALGHATYETERASFLGMPEPVERHRLSEATTQRIDESVHDIVQTAFERATAVLSENRGMLDEGAARLLERETLDETELAEFLAKTGPAPS